MTPQEGTVTLEAVRLVYRTAKGSLPALDGIDLTVPAGRFLAIVGPSGCGKSTLLKLVAGLLPASSGRVAIGGSPVTGPRPNVGMMFQAPTLLPWKSVLANVLLPARALGLDRRQSEDRARELIGRVKLGGFESAYPHELSGGMQQRVALARALIQDPAVLLMDEPFAALDALTREQMALELTEIWGESGKTILFVTHSISEAVFLADRVVVLSARPARIAAEIAIDAARPRSFETLADPAFTAACDQLRRHLLQPA